MCSRVIAISLDEDLFFVKISVELFREPIVMKVLQWKDLFGIFILNNGLHHTFPSVSLL